MAKRAWILGAGFSRSLGGPLLDDLLSTGARMRIRACFPDQFSCAPNDEGFDETSLTFWLYHFGTGFREGAFNRWSRNLNGARLWQHAEEFLEIVDRAQNDTRAKTLLKDAWKDLAAECKWEMCDFCDRKLAQEARRLIAASCSTFVEGCTKESIKTEERWDPYLHWAQQLNRDDLVITFNYDRVVELAGNPYVVTSSTSDMDIADAKEGNSALLCKLHGSVDWLNRDGKIVREKWSPNLLAKREDESEIAIASPGPSKKAVSKGLLANIWNRAKSKMRHARYAFFVGYRFPESDPHALSQILSVLGGRVDSIAYTILGPNINNPDAVRLQKLVKMRRDVTPRELWAQDFLQTYEREKYDG